MYVGYHLHAPSSHSTSIYQLGASYNTTGAYAAGGTTITNNQTGINIAALGASGYLKFWAGGTEALQIDEHGTIIIQENTGDADSSKMLFKSTKSYTNNEHENFTLVGNGSLIMISDTTSNDCGLFFATYNSGTVIEIADPQGEFANSDVSGQICCYKGSNTSSFQVKNTRGPTKNLSVAVIGCGS